jgi:hypothetical protein
VGPGRGTRGAKPPGSSWIVEILRLKFLPEKKGHTTIFALILCIINEFDEKKQSLTILCRAKSLTKVKIL